MYLEFLSHESHKFVYIYVILLSTLEVCILESILFNIYIYIYSYIHHVLVYVTSAVVELPTRCYFTCKAKDLMGEDIVDD